MLKEVNAEEFDKLYSRGAVLADFFSETCGPCKMLSFILSDVDKELGDRLTILKTDFDRNKELCEKFDVKAYPTLIFFRDGEETKRMQGLQQKPAIVRAAEELL